MNTQTRSLQYFFFGQNFSDGVRTTVAILLPALLLAQLGHFDAGLTVSTGAVCVSVTDTPGPPGHRRNGMLAALVLVGITALLTGVAATSVWLLGLEVAALSFLFTMFLIWGSRAAAVGTAGLLNVVLLLAHPPTLAQLLPHAGLLLAGGLWYAGLALLVHRVRPYRPAQQALGECIHALARFMELKAEFYNPETALDADYRQLVAQQVVVNEKQEAARDFLFRTRQIVNETTSIGRRLVLTFVETVDLYERITASYYDYATVRAAFGNSGVLPLVAALIRDIATELDQLGVAIQANRPDAGRAPDLNAKLAQLQARISALDADPSTGGSTLVLKKILVNLRDIIRRVGNIRRYFDESRATAAPVPSRAAEHARFVAHQEVEVQALSENLTLKSAVFRHAMRMMLACIVAFAVGEGLWHGQHNYWILMTVTIMLKPGFSLTRQRNTERIIGTLAGGALGGAVLWLVHWPPAQFGVLVAFMVLAYSFQRTKYLLTVVFLTAYLLILFSFLGLSYIGVVEERIADTLIGCAIAFSAGYFLFPNWESEQLTDYMAAALRANLDYLRQLANRLAGRPLPPNEYRLLRKQVYVTGANLAAAFQRMLTEPKRKQHRPIETHEFVVLNHILSSNIAALTATLREAAPAVPPFPAESRRALTSALATLHKSLTRIAPATATAAPELGPAEPAVPVAPEDKSLLEQLTFLQKVSGDIGKVTEVLAGK
ncbi:FUSC family membrane protein [Hymenobacter sp. BT770]|uniref:FUSC family membrane protein n=1 Tax=Hymenobacter sp. BT770 TaxID=2886942 RepID=UPI001D1149EF|nr:FUSC family membrane protein [Hymenobacter sp. BT770]MCC3154903.1 FUSC family protein [Hymenobacter sp. BT770]MDO3417347.1 FUSC family membrane protein [Hymenobacter sp. BT770]